MAAGFQSDVDRGALENICSKFFGSGLFICNGSSGSAPGVRDGIPLRVELPVSAVVSLADDPAVFHDHRSNQRIGMDPALASLCEIDGPPHIFLILCSVHK